MKNRSFVFLYIDCFFPPFILRNFKRYLVIVGDRVKQAGVVNKNIFLGFVINDEPIPLFLIKKLNCTGFHNKQIKQ